MTTADTSIAQAKTYVDLANRMLEVAVVKARREGRTWQSIGSELGVTHQGARARWAKVVVQANTNGAESANGVRHSPDHAGGVDDHPVAGTGDRS